MFRPAKPGRSPGYALGDPGHEYIPELTESWLGPLADEWGIHGKRATLPEREHLYRHRTPDGKVDLLPHIPLDRYRPVHGGVFHASGSLDAWLAQQTPETRARVKRAFSHCAKEVSEELIARDLSARIKKGGTESIPVKTLAVLFVHETNALGHYHLHVHLEVHNVGRSADGKYRAVDNSSLYFKQTIYSIAFMAKLANTLEKEFGLTTRITEQGVVIKGYEALRQVKTPRQEQIAAKLKERGIPRTPKALDFAARSTHAARDPSVTVKEAIRRTLAWLKEKGLDTLRAAAKMAQATSALREQKKVETTIRATVRTMNAAGRHLTFQHFSEMARLEAIRRRADPVRVERELGALKTKPTRYRLFYVSGLLTTDRIEKSRAKWGNSLASMCGKRVPKHGAGALAVARRKNATLTDEDARRVVENISSRVLTAPENSPQLKLVHDAYRADRKRRVFVVASDGSPQRVGLSLGARTEDPDVFAARLGKPSLGRTFLEIRKHRWRSLDHVRQLLEQIRRPPEKLTKNDLVVIDTRGASHHAIAAITEKAREARCGVIVISSQPIVTHHKTRTQLLTPQL